MPTTAGWLYLFAGTVLFFFWAYGIASFVRDTRRTYVPAIRRYLALRRENQEAAEEREAREEAERQLY